MDKNIQIQILGVPDGWVKHQRSGRWITWKHPADKDCDLISLESPMKGMDVRLINNQWHWICDCVRCIGSGAYHYTLCEEHDKCLICNIPRSGLTEPPWGHRDGWVCKPCAAIQHEKDKQAALERAAEIGHDEWDCRSVDKILCPHCASELSNDEVTCDSKGEQCPVCDGLYDLELEYSVSYTTTKSTKS